jgi:ribose transport system substrate-binding protein
MKMRKWLIVLMVVVLMVSIVGNTFARGAQDTGRKTIAFVPPAMISPYYQQIQRAAQATADRLGYELITLAPDSESNFIQQIQIVEDLITRRVDGIMLCAIDTTAIVSAVRRANEANIPVIMFNIPNELPGGVHVHSYVIYDQREAARMVGEHVGRTFGHNPVNVGVVLGLPSEHAIERLAGFREGIAPFPNVQVVAEQAGNWEREAGMNAATNMMTARPDINVLFGQSDEMALGAVQAVARAGATGRVTVVGFDGSPPAVASVRAGELHSTVSIGGAETGVLIVETMDKILTGQSVPLWVNVDTPFITRDNAHLFDAE